MWQNLAREDTLFQQTLCDWEAAVQQAGRLLEKSGKIQPAYTQAMTDIVRENGPYIVVVPGIALAHARPNGNVMQNSISLVTLKEGVKFGNRANDPVRAVFAIAAKTDEEHLLLFREVAAHLEDEEKIDKICRAAAYRDIDF